MPPLHWPINEVEARQKFEKRHRSRNASALFLSAVGAVDSLYYLSDLQKVFESSCNTIGGHRPDIIEVAHSRWATSACFTAIDLCAAGLGRGLCGHRRARELSLAAFDPKACRRNPKPCAMLRSRLPARALKWIDTVRRDPDYIKIKKVRHWLTHARLKRHFKMNVSEAGPRGLDLQIGRKSRITGIKPMIGIRPLIELARDVATKHVIAFLKQLPNL